MEFENTEAVMEAEESAKAAENAKTEAEKAANEATLAAQSVPQTVEDALKQAKESGEFDGPIGPRGIQGEKGDTGESGVTTPLAGFFTLSVDADGNLYAYSAEGGTVPQMEYDSATGNLYIVQEVEE